MSTFPTALIRNTRPLSWWWLLPFVAVLGSAALFYQAFLQQGQIIFIEFQQGHGLKQGDSLRYRGVIVGRVHDIELTQDLKTVRVMVRLKPEAQALTRRGSKFWIVRPQVDVAGSYGLETVVGANYLTVLPATEGDYSIEFKGLNVPPFLEAMEAGGMEIVLKTPMQGNLRRGAPVNYRQVVIGAILSVDLAADASAVAVRAYIKPDYVGLIRERAVFWRTVGVNFQAGWLSGLSLQLDSMQAVLAGGITLGLPTEAGAPVTTDKVFQLYDKPEEEWLKWVTYLEPANVEKPPLPASIAVTLQWQVNRLYLFDSKKERRGWALPLAQGLLAPADLVTIPSGALADSAVLILEKEQVTLPLTNAAPARLLTHDLALFPYQHQAVVTLPQRVLSMAMLEDTFIVKAGESLFLAADKYQIISDGWKVDTSVTLDASWHGAPVLARADGHLLGLLLVTDKVKQVVGIDLSALSNTSP